MAGVQFLKYFPKSSLTKACSKDLIASRACLKKNHAEILGPRKHGRRAAVDYILRHSGI